MHDGQDWQSASDIPAAAEAISTFLDRSGLAAHMRLEWTDVMRLSQEGSSFARQPCMSTSKAESGAAAAPCSYDLVSQEAVLSGDRVLRISLSHVEQ